MPAWHVSNRNFRYKKYKPLKRSRCTKYIFTQLTSTTEICLHINVYHTKSLITVQKGFGQSTSSKYKTTSLNLKAEKKYKWEVQRREGVCTLVQLVQRPWRRRSCLVLLSTFQTEEYKQKSLQNTNSRKQSGKERKVQSPFLVSISFLQHQLCDRFAVRLLWWQFPFFRENKNQRFCKWVILREDGRRDPIVMTQANSGKIAIGTGK